MASSKRGLTASLVSTLVLAATPSLRADERPVVVAVHTDDPAVAPEAIRAAIGKDLGAAAVAPGAANASSARGEVTVTYRKSARELVVAWHDDRHGTIARVVPAPADLADVPREAALLAGSLARDEADDLLANDPKAPPATPPPSATPPEPAPPPPPRDPPPASHDAAPPAPPRPAPYLPIAVGLLGGYGVGSGGASNLYAAGVGLDANYIFPAGLSVGGSFVYHAGFSRTVDGNPASGRVMLTGIEVGWSVALDRVRVHPFMGAGLATYDAQYHAGATFSQGTGSKEALWPGVGVTYDMTDWFFVGLDARYAIVVLGGDNADRTIIGAGQPNANGWLGYVALGFRIPD